MIRHSKDRFDLDIAMLCENIFDIRIPNDDANHFGGPLGLEKWLALRMSNQRPKSDAAALLRMLAEAQQRPELAEGLDGTWRREQISAIVRDILRKRASPVELYEMLLLPPPQRFGERPRKFGYAFVKGWRKRLSTNASVALFVVLLTLILLCRRFL
jgi:hypothetical protein